MQLLSLQNVIIKNLPVGTRKILVAVSGGIDSVVLLHLLSSLQDAHDFVLQVAHLDHQLRSESKNDASFVGELCERLGISFHLETCDVAKLAGATKSSLEMAGRQARRVFLLRLASEYAVDSIAVAHHNDDQTETFMLRLLRGTGLSGLCSMQVRQGLWWRPLLSCSRKQIMEYAREHKLEWVEDASNRDPEFLRNRLRHQLLPQMREINPQFDISVARLTHQIQIEEDYWQQQVDGSFSTLVVSRYDGLRLDRVALLKHHPALRLRLLREALLQVRGDLQRIEAVHLHAIENLLVGSSSQCQIDLPAGWVARRYDNIWFRLEAPEVTLPFELTLKIPGEVELPDGRVMRLTVGDELMGESAQVAEYAVADLDLPLRVRGWLPGDRFLPQGMVGHKRLKRYFSDNLIELEERLRVPILVSGEQIIWLVGMRRSNVKSAGLDGGAIVRIELL